MSTREYQPGAASVAVTAFEINTGCNVLAMTPEQRETYVELLKADADERSAWRVREAELARKYELGPKPAKRR